jgi:hypothetical protein
MSRHLRDNLNNDFIHASNRLNGHKARRKIVAYVESFDDVFFWRTLLSQFEDDTRYFEVMLPSRESLTKGKKSVLMNFLGERLGEEMIGCVDADYDYLIQGATPTSHKILTSPYVFHTYVYAIENYQCYAQGLHDVCVMTTLNDHAVFDFVAFMETFSEICFPLFVWSIWFYRSTHYNEFTITDFNNIVELGGLSLKQPEYSLSNLEKKVWRRVQLFEKQFFPQYKQSYEDTKEDLIRLGVTPQTTYLYIQGHHIFDDIIMPLLSQVCEKLRRERENEIYHKAVHNTQMHNELSSYQHSLQDVCAMLKKNVGYIRSQPFHKLEEDIRRFLDVSLQKSDSTVDPQDIGTGGNEY